METLRIECEKTSKDKIINAMSEVVAIKKEDIEVLEIQNDRIAILIKGVGNNPMAIFAGMSNGAYSVSFE